jgi:ribonuclease BN (tRNA processing enzyme)
MDSPQWQAYFKAFHTSTTELAAIATQAKPKLLVLYHQVFHGVPEGEMLQEIHAHYAGAVVSAHDLDLY